MWHWVLVLMAGAWAGSYRRSDKVIACLSISRTTVLSHNAELTELISKSYFEQQEILLKLMTSMIVRCVKTIPSSALDEIYSAEDRAQVLEKYAKYTPVPTAPYLEEKELDLTEEEEAVYKEIQELQEAAGSEGEDRDPGDTTPFLGTKTGMIAIVTFFAVFVGVMMFVLKGMQESDKPESEKDE